MMKFKIDEVSIDVNKIARSLRTSTEMLEPLSGDCCIYIVPPRLRVLNKEMYTPQVVSIGPFHHGKKELQAMEEHKRRYLCAFLDRIDISMEEYIEGLKELEIRLRQSYVDVNGYSREEFIEMMAVDGAFLLEFLLRCGYGGWESNDRIFGRQQLRRNVKYDMLLIENQLPFFYLEHLFKLFKRSRGAHDDTPSLKIIVQRYYFYTSPHQKNLSTSEIVTEEDTKVEHLLHFLILCLQQSETTERRECKSVATPTISELQQAGVKFKPASSSNCLSKIKFGNGILEIPKLQLIDDVEILFNNMQAFEQCHNSENYISDYICMMDMLINNEEDVKVLVQNGIIDNWLEDNRAAANVFNNLGKGTRIDYGAFCYSRVVEELNNYYKIRRHRWKATLKQNYFKNPWTIISVVAAAFLLLLTIIQTVCSIIQVL